MDILDGSESPDPVNAQRFNVHKCSNCCTLLAAWSPMELIVSGKKSNRLSILSINSNGTSKPKNHCSHKLAGSWYVTGDSGKLPPNLELLDRTSHTFRRYVMWKGPWFAKMNLLYTTDPLDIQHILCKNFKNYPKGDEFRKIFDILGDGIFSSDGELWEIHRKVTKSLFKRPKFQSLLETVIWNKVEKGLVPILESISGQGEEVDLQEVFDRFTFDTTCKILLDHDPKSLSINFPYVACVKAFSHAEEALLLRHAMPQSLWKLQQLFRVGNEKKLSDAWKSIDDFIYTCLDKKQNEHIDIKCEQQEKELLILPALLVEIKDKYGSFGEPDKLLRDIVLTYIAAGKDTVSSALSWFFYILSQNSNVEDKILEELDTHFGAKVGDRWNAKELSEMNYLHAALCESLRLFPPVPINHKSPLQPDILPSGHQVDQNTKILLSFYSMGRMKSIWGEDCMEFKPERWISNDGGIKHEPSYKFVTFNAGPRACVGKDMSFSQLKIVSATAIYRYHIELVKCHPVLPAESMVLQMKHGLKGRIWACAGCATAKGQIAQRGLIFCPTAYNKIQPVRSPVQFFVLYNMRATSNTGRRRNVEASGGSSGTPRPRKRVRFCLDDYIEGSPSFVSREGGSNTAGNGTPPSANQSGQRSGASTASTESQRHPNATPSCQSGISSGSRSPGSPRWNRQAIWNGIFRGGGVSKRVGPDTPNKT
ncbi:cytochrome P450 [Artemisia annua]|uniref:Cytochrome P450 n=1 Tax=Artemisia annua TaxID=35608 RepID=A0A2U1P168_ARTAN|nr:cytochrome P450 [Artemisia annua]